MAVLHYAGTTIRGNTVTGSTLQSAVAFVESKYRQGWNWLEVTNPATGREVGWIKPINGVRSFWADGEAS